MCFLITHIVPITYGVLCPLYAKFRIRSTKLDSQAKTRNSIVNGFAIKNKKPTRMLGHPISNIAKPVLCLGTAAGKYKLTTQRHREIVKP